MTGKKNERKLEPMRADKGQFDEVLRRMLSKNPKKTSEVRGRRSRVDVAGRTPKLILLVCHSHQKKESS